MSWYKKTQYQRQYLENDRDFGSALKRSSRLIEELKLGKILEKFAKEKGYKDALDYVICSLYPEIEKECKKFYEDRENKLINLHSANYIEKMDKIVSKAIMVFFYHYQKILKEEK